MRTFATVVVGAVAAGWLLSSPGVGAAADAAPPGREAADRAEAERVVERFEDAWNRHDMKALAGLFAQRADFVNVIGLHWRGRAEIERAHAEIHATRMRTSRLTVVSRTARLLRPDVALVHADWELHGDTGLEGKPLPPRHGVMSFVVAREGGRWLVESAQNTDVVPLPNAPPAR